MSTMLYVFYRVHYRDESGVHVKWARTLREAGTIRREWREEFRRTLMMPERYPKVYTETVEIPGRKTALLAWLNANFGSVKFEGSA